MLCHPLSNSSHFAVVDVQAALAYGNWRPVCVYVWFAAGVFLGGGGKGANGLRLFSGHIV